MDSKAHNPAANVPQQRDEEPRGDRGGGDKTWTPAEDRQGISNRPGDEATPRDNVAEHQALSHTDVIEDVVEREENRNAEHEVQQDVTGRARRRGMLR